MVRTTMTLAATIAMVAACGCTAAGCGGGMVQATRDFSLKAPWEGYERLIVRSRNGRVELASAGVSEITVEGQVRVRGTTQAEADANLEQVQIVAQADANDPKTFRIELKVPEALKRNSPGANFIVKLPAPCAAEVDTSNGSIQVIGLKGPVTLNTSNGAVRAEDIDGDLTVDTSNGGVVVSNVAGNCAVDTSNGPVEVQGTRGDVQVDTSNGSVRVDISPPTAGTVVLDTSNGSINATLPAQMAADLKLDTSNGRVNVDLGDIPTKVQRRSKTHLTASINGGAGARIEADTSNGSITLKFRK